MTAASTMRQLILAAIVAGALACSALPASAQASKLAKGPPPPPAEPAPPPKPVWDPLHAAKSIEVGKFYLKKGDYYAAIARFQQAAHLQPGLAEPFLLMGQAYEKMDNPGKAIAAYREYLKLYHSAPDRKKVLRRIALLEKRTRREAARNDSNSY
jgi:tetratricopeptide (TPR) repeat protein